MITVPEAPAAPVGEQLLVLDCPFCHERHRHGSGGYGEGAGESEDDA
jgi:hypothetical protein